MIIPTENSIGWKNESVGSPQVWIAYAPFQIIIRTGESEKWKICELYLQNLHYVHE